MEESYTPTEVAIGVFVILGVAALGFLSVSLAGLDLLPSDAIQLQARFASVGELKKGAAVKMAGVKVGSVSDIILKDYAAEASLSVDPQLELPTDTIASIRTAGLLGESFVLLRPGGAPKNLKSGDRLAQTEPAIDLIDLVVKYALSDKEEDAEEEPEKDPLGLDDDEDEDEDMP